VRTAHVPSQLCAVAKHKPLVFCVRHETGGENARG
jgi:hypothetical protein